MEIKIQPASLVFGRQKVFMLNKNNEEKWMIVKSSKKVPQKHFEMFVKAFNLRIASGFTKMDGRK